MKFRTLEHARCRLFRIGVNIRRDPGAIRGSCSKSVCQPIRCLCAHFSASSVNFRYLCSPIGSYTVRISAEGRSRWPLEEAVAPVWFHQQFNLLFCSRPYFCLLSHFPLSFDTQVWWTGRLLSTHSDSEVASNLTSRSICALERWKVEVGHNELRFFFRKNFDELIPLYIYERTSWDTSEVAHKDEMLTIL